MKILCADVPQLVEALSRERLSALIDLTNHEAIAIDLHQATLELGCDLMKIIATVEIALRNAVFANLAQHFGVANWLQQPPVAFCWKEPERKKVAAAIDSAKRAQYAKLNQAGKAQLEALAYPQGRPANISHLKRAKDRRKHIAVSDGKVIAELTLYFWKRLYGPEYEQSLWRTSLKRTFPDKKLTRAAIAAQLEIIYQSRNRLAHHEPVLHKRFCDTMTAVTFIARHLNGFDSAQESALTRLIEDDIATISAAEQCLRARLDAFRK